MTATFPAARERPVLEPNPSGKRLALLSLTALGVVYGDIGTSPLYTEQVIFGSYHATAHVTPAVAYGPW